MELKSKIPDGPVAQKWDTHRFEMKLVNPANKRKFTIIVVGSGLAGGAAAATLSELGYNVKCFCFQDSPRRAHSIAAQGGINAAKNYRNDGDSVHRLFYDTVKGGDFRAREANVYRLAQISVEIIDQCVAQGVPFAREYGGLLANRSFGGAQVSRTFYARGQTGQQLLLGAYQALEKEVARGGVTMYPRTEMLDVVVRGRPRPRHRRAGHGDRQDREPRRRRRRARDRRVRQRVLPVDQRQGLERHGHLARSQARGGVRQPVLHPDPSDLHPRQRRIPVQAHADERVAPQRRPRLGAQACRRRSRPRPDTRGRARLLSRAPLSELRQPRSRATSRRGPPRRCATRAAGSGRARLGVYLDFANAIKRVGVDTIRERYGNLFEMYQRITDENPYELPMRIFPAVHYTMGGLWVDYNLMSTIPGLHVIGEANFSDHGANRLGASALMQGLADGYFILPSTISDYLAGARLAPVDTSHAEFRRVEAEVAERMRSFLAIKGKRTVDSFHRELGRLLWDRCGMARNAAGLQEALARIPELREEFWRNVNVPGSDAELNQALEKAGRVADFLELGELMCRDALHREESCGGHFREEYQTEDGEARRDDERFAYVAAWEYTGDLQSPRLHREPLAFEYVHLAQRSYK